MKTFIGILLVGLLGFLGCSGSNDGTSTASNTVGEAIPVAPFGIIETSNPTYKWTPVPWATKYRLLVQDTNQTTTTRDTNETYIVDESYTAEEAGCELEDGFCEATPDAEIIGQNVFKVQACANDECGLWSELLKFDFSGINGPRFTDNGDDTVTDKNTKLMWSKNANLCGLKNWEDACSYCGGLTLANHSDWRLPPIHELWSLIDKHQFNPALPPGNPFMNVKSDHYWSSTTDAEITSRAWYVYFGSGYEGFHDKSYYYFYVWCVRDIF